jgi:hypothetical protein
MADRPAPKKRQPKQVAKAAPAPAPKPAPTSSTAPKPVPAPKPAPKPTIVEQPKSNLISKIKEALVKKAAEKFGEQFLQGKLTYIGLIMTALGAFAQTTGIAIPLNDIQALIDFVQANWHVVLEFVGLVTALYGRFRIPGR